MEAILGRLSKLSVLAAVLLGGLALSASARAQIMIGQVAPANPPAICSGTSVDIAQTPTSGPNPYRVPAPGVITSWSTNASSGAGQMMKVKVFRPLGGTNYEVLAHQGPLALTPSSLNTFPVKIPVQAGDLLGLNDETGGGAANACLFKTEMPQDLFVSSISDSLDGATTILEPNAVGYKLDVSATIQLAPTISALNPASGSLTGGGLVTIIGTELNGASAVNFGASPATVFTVDSETQIRAVAPPSATATAVPISVTTIAGTATSPLLFTYQAPSPTQPATQPAAHPAAHCVVPKLTGRKLKASKKRARFADCKIGTVTKKNDVTAKTGTVVRQKPKPGKVLAPGTQVNVTLG